MMVKELTLADELAALQAGDLETAVHSLRISESDGRSLDDAKVKIAAKRASTRTTARPASVNVDGPRTPALASRQFQAIARPGSAQYHRQQPYSADSHDRSSPRNTLHGFLATPSSSTPSTPFLGASGGTSGNSNSRFLSPSDLLRRSVTSVRSYAASESCDYSGSEWGDPADDSDPDDSFYANVEDAADRLLDAELDPEDTTAGKSLEDRLLHMWDQTVVEQHLTKLVSTAQRATITTDRGAADLRNFVSISLSAGLDRMHMHLQHTGSGSYKRHPWQAETPPSPMSPGAAGTHARVNALDGLDSALSAESTALTEEAAKQTRELAEGTAQLIDTMTDVRDLVTAQRRTLLEYGSLLKSATEAAADMRRTVPSPLPFSVAAADGSDKAPSRCLSFDGRPLQPDTARRQTAELMRGFEMVCEAWRGRLLP